jgi:hypothetical protein
MDFSGDGQIPRSVGSAALWLMAFQFLAYLLCCLLHRVYARIAEMSVSGEGRGGLAESLLEIVTQLIRCLPCSWTFVCPDTDSSPLFSGVNVPITHGSVHLSCRGGGRGGRNLTSLTFLQG